MARSLIVTALVTLACSLPASASASPDDHETRQTSPAPPFETRAAREALARVNVSACRDAGAPAGEGHAKVTFHPEGTVAKVLVVEPRDLPDAARTCIGQVYARVTIPAFTGAPVTLGTTWRVK